MSSTFMQYDSLFHAKKGNPVDVPIPPCPLADTHGHLTAFRKLDPAAAVARAALAGVRLLVVPVDPSDDVEDVPRFLLWLQGVVNDAAKLLEEATRHNMVPPSFANYEDVPSLLDNVYFVAGIHPYGAQKFMQDPAVRTRLQELLASERCVGLGEFGLDYGPWNELLPKDQMDAFRIQLRMAHELELPVELHLRDGKNDTCAHDDALRILEEEGVPAAGCDLHCFTSGPDVMRPFVELGAHIAFGGAATFARSESIRSAAVDCPGDLLLSETDSPYMAPVPLRGQECEPAMVAFSAECVANAREEAGVATREQTYESLWRNACDFFGLH